MTYPKGTQAAIMGQTALLVSLVQTHPDRALLLATFARAIQQMIDRCSDDPELSGQLTAFEEHVHSLIAE